MNYFVRQRKSRISFLCYKCVLRKTTQCPNFCRGLPIVGVMLNRASGLIVESLEEVAASYGKSVATHPVKVRLAVLNWRQGNH